jgi:atypical dual specificity phosphatase
MQRFYWVIDDVLAGCSRPGGDPRWAGGVVSLEGDLRRLKDEGIAALLTLTETALDETALAGAEIESLHLPVDDMTAPHPGQILEGLRFIDDQRVHGRATAVHCLQGQGRTGTVLAAYLVRDGMPPEEAIERIRELCPGALGVVEQEDAVHAFATRRDWVL